MTEAGDGSAFDPQQCAACIAGHWLKGSKLEQLADSLRPRTLEQGYQAQAQLAQAMGDQVVGFKIAATSEKGQQHIGVDGPIAGRLLSERVFRDGAKVAMQGNRMRVAECEFVFVLGDDLPPRNQPYQRDEVAAAVSALHPGLELPDSRFLRFERVGAAQLAADNACAHFLVVGEATTTPWTRLDLAQHATSLVVNGEQVSAGRGADVLGHPLDALTWLANQHRRLGGGLVAGQRITTGVSGTPWPISVGDVITARLGVLGEVSCTLEA